MEIGSSRLKARPSGTANSRALATRKRRSSSHGRLGVAAVTWVLLALFAVEASAQSGALTGRVTDQDTGSGIPNAAVTMTPEGDGATQNSRTDASGRYRIENVPAGVYRVRVLAPDYKVPQFREEIADGEVTLDVRLATTRNKTVSEAQVIGQTENKGLKIRSQRADVQDLVGEREISLQPVNDAGDVAEKLPAVTILRDFPFIRGLGDRYSITLWNNSLIPSPEPEQPTLPLDLLPAGVIKSLAVQKTYSPNLPGSFAGGIVIIESKDVPVERFFRVSIGGKYQDGSSFRDFLSYEGSRYDALTIRDGTRDLPSAVPSDILVTSGSTAAITQAVGESFDNIWEGQVETSFIDTNFSFSYGNRYELGDGRAIGILASGNWSNEYRNVNRFNALTAEGLPVLNTNTSEESQFRAEANGYLAVALELNPANVVGVRAFASRVATDTVRQIDRLESVQTNSPEPFQIEQLDYVQRILYNTQLYGRNLLEGDLFLEWRAGYSFIQRDQPDRRQSVYEGVPGPPPNDPFTFTTGTGGGSDRDFFFLDGDGFDFSFDLSIPFNPFGIETDAEDVSFDDFKPSQRIQVGAFYVQNQRELETRLLRFGAGGLGNDSNGNPLDNTLPIEELFDRGTFGPGGITVSDTPATLGYSADEFTLAGYFLADFFVLPRTRVSGGLRVEAYDLEVETFDILRPGLTLPDGSLNEVDLLPAVTLTYELIDGDAPLLLRLAASQTVNRPQYREVSDFNFETVFGGDSFSGNPNLEPATIQNYDVRLEWFPEPGEVFSLSGFFKDFDDPIEVDAIQAGENLQRSLSNAESAELFGFEVEARKNLAFLAAPFTSEGSVTENFFRNLTARANYARIISDVELNEAQLVQQDGDRSLQGAPDFVFNAGLEYSNPEAEFTLGGFVNIFGDRIIAVGLGDTDDVVEQPRVELDVVFTKKLGNGTLKIVGDNLLDDEFEQKATAGATADSFRTGWGIGVSYTIDF